MCRLWTSSSSPTATRHIGLTDSQAGCSLSDSTSPREPRQHRALGRLLDRPVMDRTGLTGTFDVGLAFSPEGTLQLPLLPDIQPRQDPNAPSIFTALREQLGLKLDSGLD